MKDLLIGMAGSGGDGIISAGESLITAAAHDGYHALMTKSFGSQIRGGESSCRVRVSTAAIHNPGGVLDVAVSLSWEDFVKFGAELPVGGATIVIHDERSGLTPDRLPLGGVVPAEVFAAPITDLAKRVAGSDQAKNTVVLGLLAGWFGLSTETLLAGIRRRYAKKGDEVAASNERAFKAGIGWSREHPLRAPRLMDAPQCAPGSLQILDGNEMCAAAAIYAGCQAFGGYPITPSTEVMQILSRELPRYGGTVLQAEDEIAGIGVALGASFAGLKAMTATSGPGMSLKTEVLGLATIAELPLVVLNVQRGGPSTGIPTKPEQSDLFQAAFSAHGDVLRPILAPTSVADTFRTTVCAFNLAERYQTPVVLLSDQEIAQRKETVERFDATQFPVEERRRPTTAELDAGYRRFRTTESGISPLSHPGMPGGNYLAAGIEHNEHGDPTASGTVHARMNAKRFDKLAPLATQRDLFSIEGDPEAPLALIAWGSVAGVCREALATLRAGGVRAKLLVPTLLYPVAEEIYREFFASVRAGLVVELSHQGQLYRILRMFVDVPAGVKPYARSGANPFQPGEIAQQLTAAALGLQREVSDRASVPEGG